jgi:uncharacterized protein YxjI
MNFLGKVAKSVVSRDLIGKVSKKLETKSEDRKKKFFDKQAGTDILVITQPRHTWKDKFNVYDENKHVKYTVKGEFASIKSCLHIYNEQGKEIGKVKKKLISLRSPISLESNPVDLIIEIDGKKIGKVKSRRSFSKQKYVVNFNGWRIEGDVFGSKYKIIDGNEEVAHISQKLLYPFDKKVNVINFYKPQNEVIVLILVIAIEAANSPSKSREIKRTLRHKSRGRL